MKATLTALGILHKPFTKHTFASGSSIWQAVLMIPPKPSNKARQPIYAKYINLKAFKQTGEKLSEIPQGSKLWVSGDPEVRSYMGKDGKPLGIQELLVWEYATDEMSQQAAPDETPVVNFKDIKSEMTDEDIPF